MTGWLTNYQRGAAVTVEFRDRARGSWLTKRAPAAIVHAFGGGAKRH